MVQRYRRDQLDELVEIMLEVALNRSPTIRIGRDAEYPTYFVQERFRKINALHIEGMPRVEKLNALVGGYINLEYRLPNGKTVKFLDDSATYLGTQLVNERGNRCFGIAANADFILVCSYEEHGENPELVVYKKR